MVRVALALGMVIGCSHPTDATAPGDGAGSAHPIDSAAAADATTTRDPADDGSFTVSVTSATVPGVGGRALPATVFAPGDAPVPRPLVVVSPGFQMARAQYTSFAHHLATWGFDVILTDYADQGLFADHTALASDVPAVIDWALAQDMLGVDAQRIAVAGHSLGGDISVFAASLDPRIKAVVGWDPVDATNPSVVPQKMSTVTAAIAVVGETTDEAGAMACAPSGDNFQAFYGAAPGDALAVTIQNADHMMWVDDASCALCSFCVAGTASPATVHTVTRRVDVAWLRRELFADTSMDVWLDHPPELTSGAISVERR